MNAPYVYRLTDRFTGKRYIGVRYANGCAPEDLGVSYFTTSKHVEPLFRADPARFDKQIVAMGDKRFVIKVEKTLIDMYDAVKSDAFYNRTNNRAIHPDDVLKGRAKLTPAHYSALGKKGGAVTGPLNAERLPLLASSGGKIGGVETCKPRFKCVSCGLETNRGNMARHSKARGHNEWEPV